MLRNCATVGDEHPITRDPRASVRGFFAFGLGRGTVALMAIEEAPLEDGEQWAKVRLDPEGNLFVRVEPVVIGDPVEIVMSFLEAQEPEMLMNEAISAHPLLGPAEAILAVLKTKATARAD